ISIIYDGVLILFKRTGQSSLWFTIAAVSNVLLNLAVIPFLGALGAAITTLVSYGILLVGRIWASRGLLAVRHRLDVLVGISVATVAACMLVGFLQPGVGAGGLLLRLLILLSWGATVLLA